MALTMAGAACEHMIVLDGFVLRDCDAYYNLHYKRAWTGPWCDR